MEQAAILVARWSPFVPLVALAARRGRGVGYALVVLAFLVSFAADMLAILGGGTWFFVPYYMIVQLALFAAAITTKDGDALLPAILVYAVLGTLLFFPMEAHRPAIPGQPTPAEYDAFMRYWYPYQTTRLASFGLFVRAAWRA